MDLPATLDLRDIFYTVFGLALLGLTLQPALSAYRFVNVPAIYVLGGFAMALAGLPVVNPLGGGFQTSVVEHISELIVIISLAGAGLAIDTPMSLKRWRPAFLLLAVAMPMTIGAVFVLGWAWLGLSAAGAMLLAAALAPTDPVLARSVQVGPPGKDETPMQLSLTAEAGLNDGLAFPFVYLAIGMAAYGFADGEGWLWQWAAFDLAYRVAMGIAVGYAVGWGISWLAYSRIGDAEQGAWNSTVMVLSSTLLSYGVAEAVDGYGFLAVFMAARAGRERSRRAGRGEYEKYVHHGAEQLESILLALLLVWFGAFLGAGALAGVQLREIGFALALIFLIRPFAGWIGLWAYDCPELERRKVAFFGIRGMGSIFYIAYAQSHGAFDDIGAVWRIAALTIALSILVHGFAANFVIGRPGEEAEGETHPYKAEIGEDRPGGR